MTRKVGKRQHPRAQHAQEVQSVNTARFLAKKKIQRPLKKGGGEEVPGLAQLPEKGHRR